VGAGGEEKNSMKNRVPVLELIYKPYELKGI